MTVAFNYPAKKLTHGPIEDIVSDVFLEIVVTEKLSDVTTHEVAFFDGGELIDKVHIYIHVPSVINHETFLTMWLHLLLDKTGENNNNRINTKRMVNGGKITTPRNLGYPSVLLVDRSRKHEWCLSTHHLVWPERREGKLPMVRKKGVRIIHTRWPVVGVNTNFGITQDQLCVELSGRDGDFVSRYFCPLSDHLSRDNVQMIHLDIPLGYGVFDQLSRDWDEREKFRLQVKRLGPLLFMKSTDGELHAIASADTYSIKALHVTRLVEAELRRLQSDKRMDFRQSVDSLTFNYGGTDLDVEQNLLSLCYQTVERLEL